ncbi:unnamed protein product [Leptosia nina]|uniref:Uncharacterized protein n=1 Tax=Leptosia nina TaxID=320188 RepID=A0AAV1IWI4_9NEOP
MGFLKSAFEKNNAVERSEASEARNIFVRTSLTCTDRQAINKTMTNEIKCKFPETVGVARLGRAPQKDGAWEPLLAVAFPIVLKY